MSLKFQTGMVKTEIERDGKVTGSISFNPADVSFKEFVADILKEVPEKQKEWDSGLKKAIEVKNEDKQMEEIVKVEKDFFAYFDTTYNKMFGTGSGEIVQGKAPLDMTTTVEIFDTVMNSWVVPTLEAFNKEKLAKYGE